MLYTIFNGPMPTSASIAPVTTGTAIKTMLQLKPVSPLTIVEWGISFDGAAAAAGIKCALVETGAIFATVTASVDADVYRIRGEEGPSTAPLTYGTSATGYTASVEGTVVAARVFDYQLVQPTNAYWKQYPLGREPISLIGRALRIRVTAAAAVNAVCYVTFEA